MMERVLRRSLSADVVGLILVLTALQVLIYGIASSLSNIDATSFFWVCFLAALIGFGLSKRHMGEIQAVVIMIVLGAAGVWVLGARLAAPLLDLGAEFLKLLPRIIPAVRSDIPIDTAAMQAAWSLVVDASRALSQRVLVWLYGLDGSIIVNDALVRNMAWSLIMWLLSGWMGWFAGRRQAIAALLPSMALLAVITSYSERRVETLWAMVFILLLLMGVWNYRNHRAHWDSKRVDYADSIRYDLAQAVLFLSITIGMLALITPSVSWQQLRDYLRERNRNDLAEMLGVQQQQVAAPNAPVQTPSLPRDHLLTGGYANSERVVMVIRTGEPPPVFNPALPQDAPRHYWRSVTYDTYVGAGWVTSTARPQTVPPNTPLIPGLLARYRLLNLDVDMIQPEGNLFWSGVLFSADVPFRAHWRVRPQSDLFADQSTLLEADLFAAVSSAEVFRAQSYEPLVAREDLQAASTDYSDAIHERYLRLPRSVPPRVRDLAVELTQDKRNAYDKAKAIESYLRTYPYDLEVPAPPEGGDVADFFLFDLKKGYCDYYASAMVVLARASGLPARFVSGYASGSYDVANAQYIVREMHAHSWAEIYFPEIGWIEFEPTASQPEIELAEKTVESPAQTNDSSAAALLNRFRLQTVLYWISPFGIVLFILILYFTLVERWWYLHHLAPALAIEKIYRRLYRMGRPLAAERGPAETASEFMRKLIDQIDVLKTRAQFKRVFVGAANEIEALTWMYQEALFRDTRIAEIHVRKAWHTWKQLRLRLLLARIYLAIRPTILQPTSRPIHHAAQNFPSRRIFSR